MSDEREETARVAEMHAAIGAALSAWALVEMELTHIFGACLVPSLALKGGGFIGGDSTASAIFYVTESMQARLRMIDVAIRTAFVATDDDSIALVNAWEVAQKRTKALITCRNRLAHWTVIRIAVDDKPAEIRLRPPIFDRARTHEGVRLHDITNWTADFVSLSRDHLHDVLSRIGAHRGHRRRFVAPLTAMVHNLRVDDRGEEADELRDWMRE